MSHTHQPASLSAANSKAPSTSSAHVKDSENPCSEAQQLCITRWAAYSKHMTDASQWRDWANNDGCPAQTTNAENPDETSNSPIDLTEIKPMLRRRLTPLGRAALWSLLQLRRHSNADGPAPLATLFSSQHGEAHRTSQLLESLSHEEPLSPTAFSLAVHNAVGGIYSIATGETGNISAISAGPDSLCAALIEARGLLFNQPANSRVWCVIYDEPIPAIYGDVYPDTNQVKALALEVRLPQAGQPYLSFTLSPNLPDSNASSPNLSNPNQQHITPDHRDHFLRFLLNEQSHELQIATPLRRWQWRKHSA